MTVLDLPETVDLVGADLAAAGVGAVGGDMTQALPDGGWDCVHLGNAVHLLRPDDAAALVGRAGAALAPGGLLSIQELVLGESPMARRFALLTLLHTPAGDADDDAARLAWMEGAGCPLERVEDLAGGVHQVLLGRRVAVA